jgi:hypothetical protein
MARTACLVCFVSTVHSKKKKEKKPITSSASSGHITKLEQSIFRLSISMVPIQTFFLYPAQSANSAKLADSHSGS